MSVVRPRVRLLPRFAPSVSPRLPAALTKIALSSRLAERLNASSRITSAKRKARAPKTVWLSSDPFIATRATSDCVRRNRIEFPLMRSFMDGWTLYLFVDNQKAPSNPLARLCWLGWSLLIRGHCFSSKFSELGAATATASPEFFEQRSRKFSFIALVRRHAFV